MSCKGSILAIDDDEAIRTLYIRALSLEGYDVVVAENGLQALDVIQSQRFDAILVDLMMPEMDGVETVSVLKASAPGVPVIVVTGYGKSLEAHEATIAGADLIVEKPFSMKELVHAVESTICIHNVGQ